MRKVKKYQESDQRVKKCVQPKVAETARLVYTMYIPKGADFMQTQIKKLGKQSGGSPTKTNTGSGKYGGR